MIVFVHRIRIIICLRDSVAFLAARLLSLRCDTHTLSRTCTALGQTCTCVLARALGSAGAPICEPTCVCMICDLLLRGVHFGL